METKDCNEGFCGIGHWEGVAEVYDGQGIFLANGADQRHVRTTGSDGRVRIDLSFVGPLKFAGHYYIKNGDDHRLYQGPVNCGFAEAISKDLVTANGYWPVTGLTQRFFLMMSPDGNRQLSLSLMYRGEELLYSIVGENGKVVGDKPVAEVHMVNGISHDLKNDPKAGRKTLLLHRSGSWEGELFFKNASGQTEDCTGVRQSIQEESGMIHENWEGSQLSDRLQFSMNTNGYQAWSGPGNCVGSYSLYGGRAMAGQFHVLDKQLRVWRREVVSSNEEHKAIVNTWYRGEEKIGTEWGILRFRGH